MSDFEGVLLSQPNKHYKAIGGDGEVHYVQCLERLEGKTYKYLETKTEENKTLIANEYSQ